MINRQNNKRTLIDSTERYDLFFDKGVTQYTGCQCNGDCSCKEDFIPTAYEVYYVKKKINKIKTTFHTSREDADKRIELINNIPVTVRG